MRTYVIQVKKEKETNIEIMQANNITEAITYLRCKYNYKMPKIEYIYSEEYK